jgi:hypothetical protein
MSRFSTSAAPLAAALAGRTRNVTELANAQRCNERSFVTRSLEMRHIEVATTVLLPRNKIKEG